MSFDSILNAVIPWAILVIGLFLLYKPLKKPLEGLFSAIKGLFKPKEAPVQDFTPYPSNIEYY